MPVYHSRKSTIRLFERQADISKIIFWSRGKTLSISQVVRRVMQGLGRGMRSPTDYCSNYILDAAFIKFYRENRMMFPMWFRDTIRIEEGVVTISH